MFLYTNSVFTLILFAYFSMIIIYFQVLYFFLFWLLLWMWLLESDTQKTDHK